MKGTTVSLAPNCSLRGQLHDAATPVNAFLGVPYATPPLGELRFRAPKPLQLWKGVRDATQFGPICPQDPRILKSEIPFNKRTPMSEDCLFLNVWTPSIEQCAKRPVMLWIHGGGYDTGCSNTINGTALAAMDGVVFVSINYRLGALGFLSTDDHEAPGNYGILDQIEALRWVQKYITNFGGDPDNVTVMGQSAGGRSVSVLILSDLTRGLFRRAISLSGVATNPSGIWSPPRASQYIRAQVKKLGCQSYSSKDIVSFLRALPVEDLLNFKPRMEAFAPVVDGHVLKDTPPNLYRKGHFHKVDYMLGFNSHEGAMFVLPALKPAHRNDLKSVRKYVTSIVKDNFFKDGEDSHRVAGLLIEKYFSDTEDGTQAVAEGLVQLYGDLRYVAPTVQVARRHSDFAKTYVYNFCHRTSFSRLPDWVAASHTNEIAFVLGYPFLLKSLKFTAEERQLSRMLMRYCTQFAKCGNPNGDSLPFWPEHFRNTETFLKFIGGTKTLVASEHKKPLMEFWEKYVLSPHVQSKL